MSGSGRDAPSNVRERSGAITRDQKELGGPPRSLGGVRSPSLMSSSVRTPSSMSGSGQDGFPDVR